MKKISRRLMTIVSVFDQVFFSQHIFAFPSWVSAVMVLSVRGLTKDLHFMTFLQVAPCVRDGAYDM